MHWFGLREIMECGGLQDLQEIPGIHLYCKRGESTNLKKWSNFALDNAGLVALDFVIKFTKCFRRARHL